MDFVHFASTLLASPALVGVFCAFVFAYLHSRAAWNTRSRGLPLPPGPRRLPLVGNMFDWPKTYHWVAFRDMRARYGDVLYFDIMGRRMMILGDPSDILELLDKRSANSSSRDYSSLNSLPHPQDRSGIQPQRDAVRSKVEATQAHVLARVLPRRCPFLHAGAREIGTQVPQQAAHVAFEPTGECALVLFDVDVSDEGDELIEVVEAALEWHGDAFTPGKYLVEAFGILKYIPPWVPGATVQKLSVHWRSTVARLKMEIDRLAKTDTGGNSAVNRMVVRTAGSGEKFPDNDAEEIVRNVAAVAIDGGSDTMFSTVQSLFVAMSLYPDVQRKAQAELDVVVGPNRLPNFEDRDTLVYINALVREALRWQNVLPFAIPHQTVEDDEFHGHFIPAGTNIFPNVWACMHDPAIYPDPEVFRPERFIRDGKLDFSTVPDPTRFVFGFGRRVCPGRYFALNGLFINIASALHVFDITPPVDENGKVIKVDPQVSSGLLCYPEDCRCTIKPRSSQAESLIREAQSLY
ncbi:cytochrome P450 [Ganoderma sinense ZZ0214-1]|uniref:Cytochrome P450 n=1 Tax=Ganoderma sinense ZZ0214-1 TaxID=1077348 RepID=A0A2G8RTA5_9APHY|nr:cytochrome P450 [Ganoderma sinense ZZ0214-1]